VPKRGGAWTTGLGNWLRREWTFGRWEQIHGELTDVFNKYIADQSARRLVVVHESLAAMPLPPGVSPSDRETLKIAMASEQQRCSPPLLTG
jgi:hypothetical protein